MNVTVDGHFVQGVSHMAPLEIIEHLYSLLNEQNRIVRSVWVNGECMDTTWPEIGNSDRTGNPIVEISLSSSTISELLYEVVSGTLETDHLLQASVQEIAYHLQCGEDEQAFATYPTMVELFQSLSAILQALVNHQMLSKDWNSELANHLEQIVEAWDRHDYVEMTDLLIYELLPALEDMSLNLRELLPENEVQA